MRTNLFAEPLDIGFGQLLAGHQALDPAIECGDCGGLQRRCRWQTLGNTTDVLHRGVHGVLCESWNAKAQKLWYSSVRLRGGGESNKLARWGLLSLREMTFRLLGGAASIGQVGGPWCEKQRFGCRDRTGIYLERLIHGIPGFDRDARRGYR